VSADEELRAAERAYRASGALQDGEAWAQAVLRTTDVPTLPMISMLVQHSRALEAMFASIQNGMILAEYRVREAITRDVTPDNIVSFLRGGREWMESPSIMLGRQGTAFIGAGDTYTPPPSVDLADTALAEELQHETWGEGERHLPLPRASGEARRPATRPARHCANPECHNILVPRRDVAIYCSNSCASDDA